MASVALLVVGCVVAALVTWLMRRYVPFPTYTTPFIVTTWALFFLGQALGVPRVEPGGPLVGVGFVEAVAHGVSQVMFQASIWTALLFLVGIALNDWRHASWVLVGSVVGMLVGTTIASGRGPSTPRASSIAAWPRTSRSGSTATTRRWRPLPCSCGGGR